MQVPSRLVVALSSAVVVLAAAVLALAVVVLRQSNEAAPIGTPKVSATRTPAPSATEVSATRPPEPPATEEKRVFDAGALATTIGKQYEEKFGDTTAQVRCPSGQQVAAGKVFYCTIAGRPERIEVTVTSDDGDYTWRPVES